MDTPRICPSCQKPFAPDVPMGLCPECLIKAGFATGAETGSMAEPPFVPPTVAEMAGFLPQLEILEFIGKGGMGAVYKARQKQLDRIVALKILPPGVGAEAGFAERFAREAKALAKLNHPGIVTLFEFGQAGALYFFLMEFVDGVNLRQLLASSRISSREALAIVPQICDALQFAHDQGIVHRDIKPENILLDRRGRVKLADFGLAKLVGAANESPSGTGPIGSHHTLTEAGKMMGTPNYMAPEQMEHPGEVDNRADIYALGVVFYQMLTGELPGKPLEPPSRKVLMDVRLDEVVLRALEKKPELRYQQASEFKTRVETIAGIPPMGAPSSTAQPSPLPPDAPGMAGLNPLSTAAAGGSSPPPGKIGALPAGSASEGGNMVTLPAIGLMVAGLWKLFNVLIVLVLFVPGGWFKSFIPNMGFFPGMNHINALILISTLLFSALPGVLILIGARQMLKLRSYAWAIGAAIISIITCSVVGLIVGIWALVVLAKPGVREAFNSGCVPGQPVRRSGSGAWIVLVIFLVILLMAGTIVGLAVGFSHLNHRHSLTAATAGKFYNDIDLALPLAAGGSFSLDNDNGDIAIKGWDRDDVVVKGVKEGASQEELNEIKAEVVSDTNEISIHTRQPSDSEGFPWNWSWFDHKEATVDYVVEVPYGTHLAMIKSVNAPIRISGVKSDITASTVNGYVEVKDARGSLKLDTGQSASFDTVNGKIEVTLPPSADVTVSASTLNGGISSDFSGLVPQHEFPIGSHLKGSLGGGGAKIDAETVNGPIRFVQGAEVPADDAPTVNNLPPVVVETDPPAGAHDVPPGETEIRVRFSKPMTDGSWSWSTAWENSTPAVIGDPHYAADGTICIIKVKLAPGTSYGYWLNSEKFKNFQDREGRPAIPYLLTFRTKNN